MFDKRKKIKTGKPKIERLELTFPMPGKLTVWAIMSDPLNFNKEVWIELTSNTYKRDSTISMREKEVKEPIYPIWSVTDGKGKVWGESEMIGNVLNQAAKAIESGENRIVIENTGKVMDARLESLMPTQTRI